MSEVQPQPGDKVRVTSVVDKNGRYGGIMSIEDGLFGATLEIVERADDPSRDPIGTTAELGGAWVKRAVNEWSAIPHYREQWRGDEQMRGRRVTGAVPGTPAAEAPARTTRPLPNPVPVEHIFGPAPLVVQYGDPEPDRHRLFTQPNGAQVRWVRDSLWRAVGQDEPIEWNQLARWRFPLREVVEP